MGSCHVHRTQGEQPDAVCKLEGDGVRCGREAKDRGGMFTLLTDLLCFMAEPIQHRKAIILQLIFLKE